MKQIRMRIDPKTGKVLELKAIGYTGGECLKDTERIRQALGMTAEPTKTDEFYVQEDNTQKLEGS